MKQSGVDEIAAERRVIWVDALEDPVDLVLAVLAATRERARDVREQSLPAIASSGNGLETAAPKERSKLGRPVERGPPHVVSFRSLHPCDDTRPCH